MSGTFVAKAMEEIFSEIQSRLNIIAIVRDAHERLVEAARADGIAESMIAEKLVEVLSEIATQAVYEYTRRTGKPFIWVDVVEQDQPQDDILMSFGLDEKGNVVF